MTHDDFFFFFLDRMLIESGERLLLFYLGPGGRRRGDERTVLEWMRVGWSGQGDSSPASGEDPRREAKRSRNVDHAFELEEKRREGFWGVRRKPEGEGRLSCEPEDGDLDDGWWVASGRPPGAHPTHRRLPSPTTLGRASVTAALGPRENDQGWWV